MRYFTTALCYLGTSAALLAASIQFEGNTSISSDVLLEIRVPLGQEGGRFVLDPKGIPMALDKVMPEYLAEDAVDGILRAVTAYYHSEGFGGARADVTGKALKAAREGENLTIFVTERVVHDAPASIRFEGQQSFSEEALLDLRVSLSQKDGKFVPDANGIPMAIGKIMPEYLSDAAVNAIVQELSRFYQTEGRLAVRADITRESYETSQAGGDLLISVTEGMLAETRVVAMNPEEEVPASVKQRVLAAAPLQENETIDGNKLDRTLGQMNRFSPDYVQPVLMRNDETGELEMEYRVNVGKTWEVGYSLDNYGSERTGKYRHTLEGHAYRLLGDADKLDLLAIGAADKNDDSLFVRGQYLLPLDSVARNRLRLTTYYSRYNSEDIGVQLLEYKGDSAGAILGFERTLWTSDGGAYLDASAGFQYMFANQDNSSLGIPEQDAEFYLPFVDLKMSKSDVDSSWLYGLKLEGNFNAVDEVELARMGRLFADSQFMLGTLYGGGRMYLDPVFGDENLRAHELTLTATAKGSLLNTRLPANFLSVSGGHATVRGYPVAVVSGDNTIYSQLDYRLHVNRLSATGESDSEFRWNPRFPGDVPPVDLSVGAFTDFGLVHNVDRLAFESDEQLWSFGLGLYGKANRYFSLSLEYAWALLDVNTLSNKIDMGDAQFYFSMDLSY